MPQSELQCPFCERTSSRPQGLASHIRSSHPKQYTKWLKTPTRLADAANPATAAHSAENVPAPAEPPASEAPATEPSATPALDLLRQAHAELARRKQTIEADLARMADLTKELEAVNAQIQALDKTLEAF